jgi:hypothetical protein
VIVTVLWKGRIGYVEDREERQWFSFVVQITENISSGFREGTPSQYSIPRAVSETVITILGFQLKVNNPFSVNAVTPLAGNCWI